MYEYDRFDQRLVEERAAQFGDQVRRRIDGRLTEEEFKPLRLQNGLYMQLHAYMMRIAIPYGLLSARQVRRLAHVARAYDRGYVHFTTRQNVQLNWPALEDVPRILEELAEVQMHAIQTSGNCIRNITSDPYAGVAHDEIEDPRPYAEILRQWSTFHPEFAFLPRKFKFAVTGAREDRAAIAVHDVGIRVVQDDDGEVGFAFYVGGGQGRTPVIAPCIAEFVPKHDLVSFSEAVLRVYNRLGRRDNKFKARIKILVKQTGADEFARLVREEHAEIADGPLKLTDEDIARFERFFRPPPYEVLSNGDTKVGAALLSKDRAFARWVGHNVVEHRVPGYAIVNLSLKSADLPPGDVTADQLDAVADVAERFSFGRVVVTHRQNLVLTDVRESELRALFRELAEIGFATPNVGKLTDVVCCPGLDYCNLANARSIPVAQDLTARFADLSRLFELGDLQLNISGCINACGHHHVGHIGILGIDKQGIEHYQLMLGGSSADEASLGKILGRALTADEIGTAVERVVLAYLGLRASESEPFLETYRRLGPKPFKEAVYDAHQA
ncbi:MAG TPA: nitrite/sulfite reductase [Sandaracinaceae bacterium LLY-WYZ-13_1]|nr:nitrite/sulfite reductase [Sandaracinaceae bacterium LLY-WYZ-13_1]